jgi:hypothetical protein
METIICPPLTLPQKLRFPWLRYNGARKSNHFKSVATPSERFVGSVF